VTRIEPDAKPPRHNHDTHLLNENRYSSQTFSKIFRASGAEFDFFQTFGFHNGADSTCLVITRSGVVISTAARSERVFFQLKRIKTALRNRLIKLATSTYLEKLIIVHIASMGLPQRVDFKRHDEEGADVLFHPHPP
jgi:hypothetical protein